MAELRIGISGWTYEPWRGVFYPKGWPSKRELEYASRQLNSIEINGTFYSLQRPSSFKAWHDATPDDFVFSVKCPRYISHMRRLKDAAGPLANFFASGVIQLGEKLGPLLWQLPPNFKWDEKRLADFFALLPREMKAAAAFSKKKHEPRMKGRMSLEFQANHPLRYAIEVRHESFRNAAFVRLCRKHRIALVIAETAGKWPMFDEVTADFMYLRLHGDEELYVSGYTTAALKRWAKRIRGWKQRGDVFAYFDNDVKVKSPFDAMHLAALLAGRDFVAPSKALSRNAGDGARVDWPAGRKKPKR